MEDILSQASIFASEASKISTQLYQKTRELGGLKSYYESTSISNIVQDLDSSYDSQKLSALQKIIALMTRGEDMSVYFAPVIKNIQTSSFVLKRLIYMYLLKYCEAEPELVLLSINSFLKGILQLKNRFE